MNTKHGDILKILLEEKNISQKDLAKKIGVTEATISKYINNLQMPRLDLVDRIADTLNVTTDYLLGRTDNPQEQKYKHLNNTLIGRVSNKMEKMSEDELELLDKLVDKIMKNDK